MSRAQKLVNRARAILQRHLPPDGLNDQKALAELNSLFDSSEPDDGRGTASELVKLANETLQRHKENALNDHQAMVEMYAILDGPESNALPELSPDQGDENEEHCRNGKCV